MLSLLDANGKVVAENNSWRNRISGEDFEALSDMNLNDNDAGMILTLSPRNYTPMISNPDGSPDVARLEVTEILHSGKADQ